MRVVFLQDHLRNGGTENQTLHLAEELAQIGYDTHIIVFRRGGVLDAKAQDSKTQIHFLRQGPLKVDWFAPGLKRLLASLAPDAVIPMGRIANCHAGRLTKASRDYKLISTFRTGKSIPALYRTALQKSDHLITNSNEALRRLNTTYSINRPEDSTVIYNGCILKNSSSQIFNQLPSEATLKELNDETSSIHNSDRRSVNLLSVCMFRPEKKQIRLLRLCGALKTSTPWHLTLAGDGPERTACQAEAKRLGITDQTSFPGLLADPSQLYAESHIALHASDSESLPNFLVEAQMAGLPVVAYDTGGVGETFVDQKSGYLIKHGDEATFLEKLTLLIDSDDLRHQMSVTARDHAHTHFTPETQIHAYQSLIERLCS